MHSHHVLFASLFDWKRLDQTLACCTSKLGLSAHYFVGSMAPTTDENCVTFCKQSLDNYAITPLGRGYSRGESLVVETPYSLP